MAFAIVCAQCGSPFESRSRGRKFCSSACSHKGRNPPLVDRFWKRVDKREGDECWNWTGHSAKGGYGVIGIGKKYFLAHRISWEMSNGEIPKNLLVCHRCDNPSCVNPSHLFIGDHLANNSDRAAKGRNRNQNGEKNDLAKLTEENAKSSFWLYESGASIEKIASQYGVSRTTIADICSGRGWRHLNLPVSQRWMRSRIAPDSFDCNSYAARIVEIMNLRMVNSAQLSRESGVTHSVISRFLRGKRAPRVFNLDALSKWSGISWKDHQKDEEAFKRAGL